MRSQVRSSRRARDSRQPCILTIAGSDSGSGAGLQADLRTINALGEYGLSVVTAVTAQNTTGVISWRAVSPSLLTAQLEEVLRDFNVSAIKTGLLPGADSVRAVAEVLARFPNVPLVIDPVIGSTTGTRFLSAAGLRALKEELFSRAWLVTPNWPEAAQLAKLEVSNFAQAEAAGRRLLDFGCGAVLVKGGHAPGNRCRDILVTRTGATQVLDSVRVETTNTHGTGCVLSAAIATHLGRGRALEEAVRRAKDFLLQALRAGRNRKWGSGAGPALGGRCAPGLRRGARG